VRACEHSDLAEEVAGAERPPRPSVALDAHLSLEDHVELVARLAGADDRLAWPVRALRAPRGQPCEHVVREQGDHRGVVQEVLVLAPVHEQRPPAGVARVLDLADEERVVAAPVGADDPGDEMRDRALDERRVVHDLEPRFDRLLQQPAGEVVGELLLAVGEDADPVLGSLVQQRVHAGAAIDRDQDERRVERDGHERVRRHAVDLLADPRRDDRDARGEHPERPPELSDRVRVGAVGDLEQPALGDLVEVRADPLGRARDEATPDRGVELLEARLHPLIVTEEAF
jgi:hypothetical protein